MTDRELLIMAARAAGYHLCSTWDTSDTSKAWASVWTKDWAGNLTTKLWNPLVNGNDAFNLLFDLNFEVERNDAGDRFYVGRMNEAKWMEDADDHESRIQAFHYAIVRAAAQIGQEMLDAEINAEIGKSMEKSQ